jgi:hypothetical protein
VCHVVQNALYTISVTHISTLNSGVPTLYAYWTRKGLHTSCPHRNRGSTVAYVQPHDGTLGVEIKENLAMAPILVSQYAGALYNAMGKTLTRTHSPYITEELHILIVFFAWTNLHLWLAAHVISFWHRTILYNMADGHVANYIYIYTHTHTHRDRDSAVGIATRYGLEGLGIESRWGRDFLHPSRPALGPTQPPIKWVLSLFPVSKAAGAWRWPPIPI